MCAQEIFSESRKLIEVQYAQSGVLLLDQLVELKATILVFGI
jgi:hypothetical protein